MRKIKRVCAVLLLLVLLLSVGVSAGSSYTGSFTRREAAGGTKTVYMPDVYRATDTVYIRDLGLNDGFDKIQDMACDAVGNTYLLVDPGRVIVLNKELQCDREFIPTAADGTELNVEGARGIFAAYNGNLYISDTENARVLRCDGNGLVLQEIKVPESDLIPSDFTFRPMKVSMDSQGYLYVLSDGSYYGALLYDPMGEFSGFYGANSVQTSVLTTLENLWDMLVQNDVKRAKTERVLPFQFIDLFVDENDFVYTCTGQTSGNSVGQLRKLSPGGTNILEYTSATGAASASDSYNFGEKQTFMRLKKKVQQNFTSVLVDDRGFIYALDRAYGLIYVYDQRCTLMTVFGGGYGSGTQQGVFSDACAMDFNGDKLFVADAGRNTITLFEMTTFGNTLLEAQSKTLDSAYTDAKPFWNEVLLSDSGNQLAQRGLAKAAYVEGDYQLALELSRQGRDASVYGQALGMVQNDFIEKHFVWLFPLVILLVVGIVVLMILSRKRSIVLVSNQKLRLMLGCVMHPFRNFQEIKYKKLGSLPLALVITFLFFLTGALQTTLSDFRATSYDPTTYNLIYQIARTIGLVVLWSLANWGVSALAEGKGKLKEVFIVTGYSMLPMVVYQIISIPLSYAIQSSGDLVISSLQTVAIILAGIMLCVGLMTIHDYTFPRLVFVAVLTVLGMILVIFVLFMVGMMISQFWEFIVTVFMEVVYR